MGYSFCLLFIVSVTLSHGRPTDLDEQWAIFKKTSGKAYGSQTEETFRKMIFTENSKKIARHHEKFLNGESTFDMAMNEFGDMLHHEFVSTMSSCLASDFQETKGNATTYLPPENVEVPKSINWVAKGFVTPVKNQGGCGSCWAFSATGSLEGQHKKKTGKLVSLSEQNLVDCSGEFGNRGCNGGLPNRCFRFIQFNKGIDTEESYPYEGADGKCRFNRQNVGATDTGFVDLWSGREDILMKAVGTVGPVSAGIDASQDSFQFYSSGVYDEEDCSTTNLGHSVLIVGYGKLKGKDFWLVKNSWGTSWGKQGYIRMSRNKENQCGIATFTNYPLV